jgi:hypothetical protein
MFYTRAPFKKFMNNFAYWGLVAIYVFTMLSPIGIVIYFML